MMDSLAFRNDAAIVLRRLIRSLPTRARRHGRRDVRQGPAGDDDGPRRLRDLPGILVPGGVTLPPTEGEDAGKIQTIGVRFAHGKLSLAGGRRTRLPGLRLARRRLPVPRHRGDRAGRRRGAGHVPAALGAGAPAASRSGSTSPRAPPAPSLAMERNAINLRDVLTDKAIHNAMVVHAAFGGSTNLLLHVPAIAHAAGLRRPTVDDWIDVNRKVPRLVDALPNGPVGHVTVQVFLAGGVPEVMLHLRDLGLLHDDVLTVAGVTLGEMLDWWETSDRRARLRERSASRTASTPTT